MIHVVGIIENPLTGVASDDLIVPANFLEDLWADAHLAYFTFFVARSRDADASAMFAHAFILRNEVGRNRALNILALCQARLERAEIALVLGLKRFPFVVHFRLIFLEPNFRG